MEDEDYDWQPPSEAEMKIIQARRERSDKIRSLMGDNRDEDYDWQPPSEAEMKIIQARRERSDKISSLMGDYLLKGYKMLGITCPACDTILLQYKEESTDNEINYCVACQELDTDTNKDDPVLSSTAALTQMREGTITDLYDTDDLSFMRNIASRQQIPKAATVLSSTAALTQMREGSITDLYDTDDLSFMRNIASRQQQQTPQIPQTVPGTAPQTIVQGTNLVSSTTFTASDAGRQPVSNGSQMTLLLDETVKVLCEKIHWAAEELKRTNSVDYNTSLCQMIKSAADALQSVKMTS